MRTLIFLLLLLIPSSKSTTHPGDIAALKSLLTSLSPSSIPPNSCLSTWHFNLDPCLSFSCGLRCSSPNPSLSRVTALSLDPAGYSGPLPPSIWSLHSLQSLDLSDNRLSGPLPPPPLSAPSFPPLLRRISLSRNSLSGPLPPFPNAPALQQLYLDDNDFSGGFPDLRPLSNLRFLDASQNTFWGPFPPLLPPSLFELSLRDNSFSGALPAAALASLPALQVLDLSHNGLSGAVPAAVFEHGSLQQLSLSGNAFGWVERPAGGGGGSNMVALDLSRNRIGGLLPEFVGAMPRLAAVDLEDNLFDGLIPVQYALRAAGVAGGWVPFERLLLGGNYLYGPIPGLMEGMKEGMATISLADNCLFRCPEYLYFCAGGEQKPETVCREFNPMIP